MVAAAIVRYALRTLPLRLRLPDGTVLGAGGIGAPELTLHRPSEFFRRLGAGGLIGFGESYQAGDWDSDELARSLTVFAAHVDSLVPAPLQRLRPLLTLRRPRLENATALEARENIAHHYDLSNKMFALFLDPTLTYSSALFEQDPALYPAQETTAPHHELVLPDMRDEAVGMAELERAQQRKIDRLLDATGVTCGSRVLEIGSGWGELAVRAALRGAHVRTITLSQQQLSYVRARVEHAGLEARVQAELLDFREACGSYDAVLSVEMIESIGRPAWPDYFRTLSSLLSPGGRVGLQAITMPHERMLATARTQTWITKYIFPGGLIPSMEAIRDTAARSGLTVADDLAFGAHYARTLALWNRRMATNAAELRDLGFDEAFQRTWRLYLAYSQAGFAAGYLDVHQLVLVAKHATHHAAF